MVGAPGGPDVAERARTRGQVVAVARSATASTHVTLDGPNAYTLTGELIAWAAHRLLTERPKATGVVGPVEAFGFTELAEGCTELGLAPV